MSIPAPSFEQAMEITAQWLNLWEAGELSDEVLADRIGELVASRDGARGFFVITLAGESPLLDRLPDPLVIKLRAGGASIVDLTVRNLAMSTAMAVEHQRRQDEQQQAGSVRVTARCTELLRLLQPESVKTRLEQLLEAVDHNRGKDVNFLERWGYDADQRKAIGESIVAIAER